MSIYCYVDGPEFYTWSEPIARKQHPCIECAAPILKGERYFLASGKWEGDFSTYRQHLLCCEACMYFRDHLNDGECLPFGSLRDALAVSRGEHGKSNPHWKEFRSLMARILWRARPFRQRYTAPEKEAVNGNA